jgi:S-adenosylmethionine decarboxylase
MSKPFGYSYLLDMYNCRPGAADDLELHYRFLESLVDKLGMTKMSAPIVIHGPRNHGEEMFPDKAGVSGWVPLIESGIQIHSLEPSHFITLDVYSCKPFQPSRVLNAALEAFGFQRHEDHVIERGVRFGGDA